MNSDGKVLIVGAGPAGSLSAYLLGKRFDVVVVEEHQTPGFPVQCAGLISEKCFKAYSNYCRVRKAVENRINGALFFSPSGNFLEVPGKAYVIDRKILDSMLLRAASKYSEVLVKTKVRFDGRVAKFKDGSLHPEYIIGADGCYSTVARSFGFERYRIYPAIQVEKRFEAVDERCVELYFGKRYSNGFFAYSIPLGDTAKIGVVSRDEPHFYLKNLLEKHPSVSRRVRGGAMEVNAGCIPAKLVDFVRGKIALIGDAAGMVKPYTGGGLYYLLRAAEILSETFPDLQGYRRMYLGEFGREHDVGRKIRGLYTTLSDDEYDELIRAFRDFDFSKLDMDRPSTALSAVKTGFRLISKPVLALKLLRTLFP